MEVAQHKLREATESPTPTARSIPVKAMEGERSFGGLPMGVSAEEKLTWLQTQIIGGEAEFGSPFGRRRVTYADHTASGRCLRYIEEFIVSNVLPSYGELTTTYDNVGC